MRRESSSSAEVRFHRIDYDEVMGFLKRYAEKIVGEGRALLVILYGSLARGDYTAFSDADILIIVEETVKRPIDRPLEYMEPSAPIPIEIRVLTLEEVKRLARSEDRFIRTVFKEGKLLAGDKELYRKLSGPGGD